MAADLPDYYFRGRDNGAFVFRIDTESRQRRIDMDQIAVLNIRNGEIKPHGDRTLSEDDLLLAMHDLRSVLVRKKAERLMRMD
jgi:hypothetical protein